MGSSVPIAFLAQVVFYGRSSWSFINEAGGLPDEPKFGFAWTNLWHGIVV